MSPTIVHMQLYARKSSLKCYIFIINSVDVITYDAKQISVSALN
jgi:hypothetical protein